MVTALPPTPDAVAKSAEAITRAQQAVERLYQHEWESRSPTLKTMTLRLLSEDLGELRRQLLDLFSE